LHHESLFVLTQFQASTSRRRIEMGDDPVNVVPPPLDLSGVIGSSAYYLDRHKDFASRHPALRPPAYYLAYGRKYFERFQKLRDHLSEEGRAWVARTAFLLQKQIEDRRANDPFGFDGLERTPRLFRRFAYGTHPTAYLEGGLAGLPAEDVLLVVNTPDAKDLLSHDGIAQVVKTALAVVRTNGPRRNTKMVADAVRVLGERFGRDTADALETMADEAAADMGLLQEGLARIDDQAREAMGAASRTFSRRVRGLAKLPPLMGQGWRNLGFCSWRLPAEAVRPVVPPELQLDLRDGFAWVSMVPLEMVNVGLLEPKELALPAFAEINLRTYVRHRDQPGVYFLSLDCGQHMVNLAAGTLFGLPYLEADVSVVREGEWFCYESRRDALGRRRAAAMLRCRYRPEGQPARVEPGSLNAFLIERYSLFTVRARSRRIYRGDIEHPRWTVAPGVLQLDQNTVPSAAGLPIAGPPDHFCFSPGVDTRMLPFVDVT
jgi:uncharacterized protein YqjF (DUF2071 family)